MSSPVKYVVWEKLFKIATRTIFGYLRLCERRKHIQPILSTKHVRNFGIAGVLHQQVAHTGHITQHLEAVQTLWPTDKRKYGEQETGSVTFVEHFDAGMETKDGYYFSGYLVNIDHVQAKKFDGKKARVTGAVTIIKGLDSQQQKLDSEGNPIRKQGCA